MLIGRDQEQQAIQALAAAARVGQSGVLLLTGEAGIGKSALLQEAVAGSTGLRLLRATGAESESEVPFGGLLQLLRPVLDHLAAIPAPQAEALAAALALRPGTGADRFAVGAATLSLLSRAAQDQPLAVVVDDAHLLDQPSAQALVFTARRLTADPVLLLAAVREGQPCLLLEAGLPVLPVRGLSAEASGRLVRAAGRRLGAPVAARLFEVSGGNPLALLELADDVAGVGALPPGAPVPVSASLARTFAHRADQLSAPARTALLVAATGGGEPGLTARACALLGVDATALDEAEAADLVRLDRGALTFRHGLVRSAVYSEASPAVRRAVHRALAAALPPEEVDRRSWHLGEAARGPDEETARLLERAAGRARDRSASAVAAAAFERAAVLSPDPADRARRLVSAAGSAWQAGAGDRAAELLERASGLPCTAALRAVAAGLSGTIAARTGSVEDARDVLLAAGLEHRERAPDTAIGLFADSIMAGFFLADTAAVAEAAARIDELVPRARSDVARCLAAMAAGVAGVLTGQGGPDRLRAAVALLDPAGPLVRDPRLAPWLVVGPLFLRDGSGREQVETAVEDLRRRTDLGGLPLLLFLLGRDQATRDSWDVAEVHYSEGIELAREAGHTSDLVACLAGLAWLEARQGRDAACREHAAEAVRLAAPRRLALFQAWSLMALGELDLGAGRVADAIGHLERLVGLLQELGVVDVDLSPVPELVEALVHAGRADDAAELARQHAVQARAKGQPWALARASRALALTCPEAEVDEHFRAALGHHAQTLDRFELARTQLAQGARLRRARRRTAARAPLEAALAGFEALGAAPWADRAAAELRATGRTAYRRTASGRDRLTPQELQIATLLAAGRTTREAATALFLSPKTVEYHLRHVYLKLGVASRAELSGALDDGRLG